MPLTVYLTVSALAVLPVRVTVNWPAVAPSSVAVGSVASMLTTGSVSLSATVTVALEAPLSTVYWLPDELLEEEDSDICTVSFASTRVSSIGVTVTVAVL